MSALGDDLGGEAFEGGLVGKVADEPRPLLDIDDMNRRPFAAEALGDALADSLRPAGDDNNFVFECDSKSVSFILESFKEDQIWTLSPLLVQDSIENSKGSDIKK